MKRNLPAAGRESHLLKYFKKATRIKNEIDIEELNLAQANLFFLEKISIKSSFSSF